MVDKQIPGIRDPNTHRGFLAALVIASVVLFAFSAVNLPLQYVERECEIQGSFYLSGPQLLADSEMPTMAGWPMRYLIRYPGEQHCRYFSWAFLFVDLAIIVGVGLVTFWAVRLRERKIAQASNQGRTQKRCDVLFAIIILLIPTALLATAKWSSERQRRPLRNIGEKVNVELSCWYPKVIASKIPTPMRKFFLRPRGVEFVRGNPGDCVTALALKELVAISFYRSEVADDYFRSLSNHHHLSRLTLVSQPVTTGTVRSIAKLRYIKRLRLNRNDLGIDSINCLSHWDKLTSVHLGRNAIDLSKLQRPAWANTVVSLSVSRPQAGVSDELTLEGWPHLKHLAVSSNSITTNDSTLAIRLADLPALESLNLDRLQKHSLNLTNLPKLEAIEDWPAEQQRLARRNIWIPTGCWAESVRIFRLPRLSQCRFYAQDLQSFQMEQTPNCDQMEFSWQLIASNRWVRQDVSDVSDYQWLINVLGKSDASKALIFQSLPLSNLDISPLIQNSGIHKLRFLQCNVNPSQVYPESPTNHLVELDLDDCVLRENQLHRLLVDYPNLEVLRANGKALKELNLIEPNKLRVLQLDRFGSIEKLRMIDQPDLIADVRCLESPRILVIKNSESLLGIVLENPLKPGAEISGLRDLEWFAAGGPEINDQIVQQVLTCPNLDRLTLAYPRLSRAMLRQIGQVEHLTALIIPGAGIDQGITDQWHSLKSLWEVNLDESEIGGRAIRWLSKNESLRSVSLARAKITASGLESLSLLSQVVELSLSDVKVAHSDIAMLLEGDSLEYLDLSGCQIDDAMIEGLLNSRTLLAIKLHRCELSDSQIERLKTADPRLAVITNDEPLRRIRPEKTVVEQPDAIVGMEAPGNFILDDARRTRGAPSSSGAIPVVVDALDLNRFRS